MSTDHEHRVCTYQEAEDAVRAHEVVYINNCFCRTPAKEGKAAYPYCGHPLRTCIGFYKWEEAPSPSEEITRAEALEIVEDWRRQGNLFRFMADDSWVCLCCSCGCGFFHDEDGNRVADPCDKSAWVETTDAEACTLCGKCVDVCAYDARRVEDETMIVDREKCYGCSACEFACPVEAIAMVPRGCG